jgi:DNA mismatch repair protein MutL
MPSRIQVLPEALINRIAAGEVVERPASVVKELIENAMDAESKSITIEVEDGGKRSIRVTDNGEGMSREDAVLAFQRHATSKIKTDADLEAIATMGFRGEALPSIASVSKICLVTRQAGDEVAARLVVEAGNMKEAAETASPAGTMIEVGQLFFNTPARRKFLKTAGTELAHITGLVTELALARPDLEFRLLQNGRNVFHFPCAKGWHERAIQIFGAEMAEQLVPVEARQGRIRLTGGISRPHFTRGAKTHQFFFVNGRSVRDRLLAHALYEAYDTLLMKGRHPVAILFIELDSSMVDVNVHPAKREVRFRTPQEIHRIVIESVRAALRESAAAVLGREKDSGAGTGFYKERVFETAPAVFETEAGTASMTAAEERKSQVREAAAVYLNRQGLAGPAWPAPVHPTGGSTCVPPTRTGYASSEPVRMKEEKAALPLGQIQNSYILADIEGDLAIIDQHAAHERILYERLLSRMAANRHSETQPLLIPETVELSARDSVLLRSYLDKLEETGLEIEEFGPSSFVIRSIPTILVQKDLKRLVSDLVDDLREWERAATVDEIKKRLAASLACHGAVRAHDALTLPEMSALLHDLKKYPAVHSCPHGRPIQRRFTLNDLEKMFGRR